MTTSTTSATSTILVTGATGQVGRRLVPRLLSWRTPVAPGAQPAEQVRVLVRTQHAADGFVAAGAQAIVGDVTDAADRKRALDGVDVVVNSAATFRSPDITQADMDAVNRDAALALARESAEAGVRRFVQISTNLVYGPGVGRPVREDDPLRAEIGYPRSKREAEELLEGLREETGFGVVTLRLAFVYGDGDPHIQNYLPRVTARPGHAQLVMVHHADVAQAVLHAIHVPGIEGRAYNIAGDGASTAFELHEMVGIRPEPTTTAGTGGAAGDPATFTGSTTAEDPWFGVPDTTRAFRELGFRPIYPTARAAWRVGVL
jgi:nucleoside-diphosphate-sugar epimerase